MNYLPHRLMTVLLTLVVFCAGARSAEFFIHDGDRVFRTYFINSRGDEQMGSTWNYLDITALGRQEKWENSPKGYPQTPPYEWWNWHDEFSDAAPSQEWSATVERGIQAGQARRRS